MKYLPVKEAFTDNAQREAEQSIMGGGYDTHVFKCDMASFPMEKCDHINGSRDMYKRFNAEYGSMIRRMSTEFRMRVAARNMANTQQQQTGNVDIHNLCHYRTREDIFKRTAVSGEQINHCFTMFIDNSSSMSSEYRYNFVMLYAAILAEFCRVNNIPFAVYLWTSACRASISKSGVVKGGAEFMEVVDTTSNKGDVRNIIGLMSSGAHLKPMVGTPMAAAKAGAAMLSAAYKKRTGANVSNVFFLTDGEGMKNNDIESNGSMYKNFLIDIEGIGPMTINSNDRVYDAVAIDRIIQSQNENYININVGDSDTVGEYSDRFTFDKNLRRSKALNIMDDNDKKAFMHASKMISRIVAT